MNLTGFYKIVTKLEGKKRAEAKWEALQEDEAQRQVKIETSKSWFFFEATILSCSSRLLSQVQ